jgi:hypothetical protein
MRRHAAGATCGTVMPLMPDVLHRVGGLLDGGELLLRLLLACACASAS